MQPIADKTSLHLEPDGLAILREIESPVAPVVVIGPYRSGKSFLLNQLLGVGCGMSLSLFKCHKIACSKEHCQISASGSLMTLLLLQMKALVLATPGGYLFNSIIAPYTPLSLLGIRTHHVLLRTDVSRTTNLLQCCGPPLDEQLLHT